MGDRGLYGQLHSPSSFFRFLLEPSARTFVNVSAFLSDFSPIFIYVSLFVNFLGKATLG